MDAGMDETRLPELTAGARGSLRTVASILLRVVSIRGIYTRRIISFSPRN